MKAFSLIELMLYISIVSIFILVVVSFWGSIGEVNERNRAMSILNSESQFIMNNLTNSIRKADSYTINENSLTLNTPNNPIIISYVNNDLTIKEGNGDSLSILNNNIEVKNITFTDVKRTDTKGAIRIYFKISTKGDIKYENDYYNTVTIR